MRAPSPSEVPVSCEKGNVGSGNEIVNQPNDENNEHRGKRYAHALTSALPVCTCGFGCPN